MGLELLTSEQRRFFEDLLAFLRDELEARKDPAAAEQRAEMFGALAGDVGRTQVLKDKRLAEEGFVYLAKRGEKYLKHVDELSPRTCRASWPRWNPPRPSAGSTRRASETSTSSSTAGASCLPPTPETRERR